MATAVATETAAKEASVKAPSVAKPDVEKIMSDIRRTARARAEEGTRSEREFRADVKKRMLAPLGARDFSEEFADRIRSRDASRWNVQLTAAEFHGSSSAPVRLLRWVLKPLARLFFNVHPAVEQAARQAEINEYHRRLLWATNRDLEFARLELDLIKSELRRLGIHADFSFSPSAGESGVRGSGGGNVPGRGRSDGRGGRPDRGRSDRGRSDRGRSDRGRGDRRRGNGGRDRDSGSRRERSGSPPASGSAGGTRQNNRPENRPDGQSNGRSNGRPNGQQDERPNRGARRAGGAPGGK